jgi:glycine/D-amino acid oxidase-like deaminating enzyme
MNTKRIAVVGGGILGVLIAQRLISEHPGAEISLITAGMIGDGASSFSGGIHLPYGKTDRVRAMSVESAAYYAGALQANDRLPIMSMPFVAAAPCDVRDRFTSPLGVPGAADLRAGPESLCPVPEPFSGWMISDSHVANVRALAEQLAEPLRRRVRVWECCKVLGIDEQDASTSLSLSTGERHVYDMVVIAAGPWVNDEPFGQFTRALKIRTKRVVALHLDWSVSRSVGYFWPTLDAFIVPLRHRGHWLFSYTCPDWDVSPSTGGCDVVTAEDIRQGRELLQPFLTAPAGLKGGRVFYDGYSLNGEPVVSWVGHHQRIMFAGAANGSGYRLAPAIAAEVSSTLAAAQQT